MLFCASSALSGHSDIILVGVYLQPLKHRQKIVVLALHKRRRFIGRGSLVLAALLTSITDVGFGISFVFSVVTPGMLPRFTARAVEAVGSKVDETAPTVCGVIPIVSWSRA